MRALIMKQSTWWALMILLTTVTRTSLAADEAAALPALSGQEQATTGMGPVPDQQLSKNGSGPDLPAKSVAPLRESELRLEPGPWAIGKLDLTLVDSSRPTAANRKYPGAPSRRLKTTVW